MTPTYIAFIPTVQELVWSDLGKNGKLILHGTLGKCKRADRRERLWSKLLIAVSQKLFDIEPWDLVLLLILTVCKCAPNLFEIWKAGFQACPTLMWNFPKFGSYRYISRHTSSTNSKNSFNKNSVNISNSTLNTGSLLFMINSKSQLKISIF